MASFTMQLQLENECDHSVWDPLATDVKGGFVTVPQQKCPLCRGSGYVLTNEGMELLDFIRRHLATTAP